MESGVAGWKDFASNLRCLPQIPYDRACPNRGVTGHEEGGLAEAGVRGWAASRWACRSVYFSQGRAPLAHLPKVTSLSIEAVNRQLLKNKVPFSFLISSSSSSL